MFGQSGTIPDAGDRININWSTHLGTVGGTAWPYSNVGYSNLGSAQILQSLNAAGTSAAALTGDDDSSANRTGDLIELGFFDTDPSGTITPNTDTTDLFHGVWTPITSQTTSGQDMRKSGTDYTIAPGLFAFQTEFYDAGTDWDNYARTNWRATGQTNDTHYLLVDDQPSSLSSNIDQLVGASSPLIGIRFYDGGVSGKTNSVGGTRYNTIMNPNWVWPSTGSSLYMGLYDNAGTPALDTNLKFEFDNTTYGDNGTYTALIGTGASNSVSDATANALDTDDFVATITYYDGDDTLNLSDSTGANAIGNAVLSGLSGTGDIGGANDGNLLTLHSNNDNDGDYTFSGNIYTDGSTSTDLTIQKTGTGEQSLTGNINALDSDSTESGFLNIAEGTLTLNPASGKTQVVEFLTGGGTLKLDNSGRADQSIDLGFANTAEKKTFTGAITLSGSGTNTVNVGGADGSFADFDAHQEFSGAISGSANLKKTGSGKLTLTGNSGSFGGGVTVADGGGTFDGGIVVANHANALGTGTARVEHGKLAVAGGITVTNTIQGQATNATTQKSVIGGGVGNSVGTITNGGSILNIGSGDNEIDVVSPGIAMATSMSNGTSDFQSIAGNHNDSGADTLANSIGTMKINSVGLKTGGVFDWEITNFDGNNGSGADWDVLQFDSLAFDGSGNFDINIFGVASNGASGGVSGSLTNKTGTSGFKFLDGSGSNGNNITWGSVTIGNASPSGSGTLDNGFLAINSTPFSHTHSNYYGDWSVYYDHSNNDFYLQYSVVPEPSTYFMVSGLLLLPGLNFLRRFRNSPTIKS